MRNYSSRFRLPNGKWAHIQLEDLAEAAERRIAEIRRLWRPPDYFFHLRSGGHISALNQHRHNSWYGKVDLSSFFNNVTRHRITRSLKKIGYSFRDAEEFAVASTVSAGIRDDLHCPMDLFNHRCSLLSHWTRAAWVLVSAIFILRGVRSPSTSMTSLSPAARTEMLPTLSRRSG